MEFKKISVGGQIYGEPIPNEEP